MKLYPIPGGTWAGTEADWKKAMKAKGFNPKDFENTKTREVPTGKADLIEFLNFNAVDVYRLPAGATQSDTVVDVDALRAEHNPGAPDLPTAPPPGGAGVGAMELTELFAAAPIRVQAELVVAFADRAVAAAK